MDAMMPLACLPVEIAGRNRVWRHMIIDAIKTDPEWKGGDYTTEPQAGLRVTMADMLIIAGSAPIQLQNAYPTRAEAAEAYEQKAAAHIYGERPTPTTPCTRSTPRAPTIRPAISARSRLPGHVGEFRRRLHQPARTRHRSEQKVKEIKPRHVRADPGQRQDPWPRHPHLGGGLEAAAGAASGGKPRARRAMILVRP